MDARGEEARHDRGMRDRVFRWAGRKVNQFLESDSTPTPLSTPGHHNESSQQGSSHGQDPIQTQQSDPRRLLFKASPLPVLGTTTNTSRAAYSPRKPYPPNITVSCVDFLGEVHSATTYVKRDLGFQGQIGSFVLLSYGDTMYSDANYSDKWRGMTSDSVALATHDPLVVVDPVLNQHGYPPQFCPIIDSFGEDASECALGITNVVQTTSPDDGVLFFLLNHRPDGKNNLVGAGVASVHLDTSRYPPAPHIRRLARFWWDASQEPWYGDICALRHEGYVYAYGHGGHADQNPWVYVARARLEEATNLDCYEYWNGESWQRERLKTKDLSEKESVFWQINQGQVVWNEYLGCFIFVYCDNWMNSKVLMKTAQNPEGPWSEAVELYQATPVSDGGAIYAAIPHDYYDRDGPTLVVTFTNHPNTIQAVKVTFG